MRISSTEFQQNVGRYQDTALRQPVVVTKNGRDHVVILSAEDYKQLRQRSREVLLAGALSDDELEAVARAEMPAGRDHLNDELA